MKKLILATILIIISNQVQAATLKDGALLCDSEQSLDRFTKAAAANDKRLAATLLESSCFAAKGGYEISIIDEEITGTVHLMVYLPSGKHSEAWSERVFINK